MSSENPYKTVIIGDQGQDGDVVVIDINPTERLERFVPLGWGVDTIVFREDGTVEVYGLIPFKEEKQ